MAGRTRWVLVAFIGFGWTCPPSVAQTYTWRNPTSGNWETAANWQSNQLPVSGNGTQIVLPAGTYSVSQNGTNNFTFNGLSVAGLTPGQVVDLFNNSMNLGGTTPTISVGGSGTLNVRNNLTGASLTKTGTGTLGLVAPTTLTVSDLTVSQGLLLLRSGVTDQISSSARLSIGTSGQFRQPGSAQQTLSSLSGGGVYFLGDVSAQGAALTVNQATDSTFSGLLQVASGSSLTKQGAGNLTLSGSGSNTVLGSVVVGGGTLTLSKSGGATAVAGSVVVSGGNGIVATSADQFDPTTRVSFSGSAASFTLQGNSQQVARLTGSGGTLGLGSATLTVNQTSGTDSLTFQSTTGTGGIVKTGGGSWAFDTSGGGFTGLLRSGGGEVVFNGTSGGTGRVDAGARLTGSGGFAGTVTVSGTLAGTLSAGGVTVHSGGVVAPGFSLGTISSTGSVTFRGGSGYQAELGANAGGTSDRIAVGGANSVLNFETTAGSPTVALRAAGFTGTAGGAASYTLATVGSGGDILIDGQVYSDPVLGEFVVGTGNTAGKPILLDPTAIASSLSNGDRFQLRRSGTNLQLTFTPVPEPGGILLLAAIGCAGVITTRRILRTRNSDRRPGPSEMTG